MKQKKQTTNISWSIDRLLLAFAFSFLVTQVNAQLLTDDEESGNWSDAGTWVASQPSPLTSGIDDQVTIQGDVYRAGALDFSIVAFGALTIRANDTLTVDGNLTFTSAVMFVDVELGGVLKVYGDFDTNGSSVSILGNGTIVISGDLILDGTSTYTDSGGNNDLYIDGSVSGTSSDVSQTQTDSQTFTDLATNQPVLHTEVVGELPVELVSFDGWSSDGGVKLAWSTASEENFDHFEIQRSSNGHEYSKIGEVQGHGNSNQLIEYEFFDESARGEAVYYRLKAIDFDGSYEIFESVRVDLIGLASRVDIYPNPISQFSQSLRVEVHRNLDPLKLTVFSPGGRVLLQESFNENISYLNLDRSLAKGIYHLRIQTTGQVLVRKFLVN